MNIVNSSDRDVGKSFSDKCFRINICGIDIYVGETVVCGNGEGVILIYLD